VTILTRQERERLVLNLYNQGRTYREICKEARISPRDIGVILNKTIEEKTERVKMKNKTILIWRKTKIKNNSNITLSLVYKLFSNERLH
jgi:hypothetical protein